jgi:pimeloyl-ACP methyl ester carboxylesterase
MAEQSRDVISSDGTRLAVYESGPADAPTIVAVHGYPDNHTLWDELVGLLRDDFRVVAYDVRGAGGSDKPSARRAYRLPQLTDDLIAVVDATSPARPVHLVGHDWGSMQLWPAVTDDRLAGRIASFTSMSGPSLEYAGSWLRNLREHPRASLKQFARSYYMVLFQLPLLPELAARRGVVARGAHRAGRPMRTGRTSATDQVQDAIHGVQLYRANALNRVSRPRPSPAQVPVQLVVAEDDPFATPRLVIEATTPWVPDLTVVPVSGGHWWFVQQPAVLAGLIRDFVAAHPAATAPADTPRDTFGDTATSERVRSRRGSRA